MVRFAISPSAIVWRCLEKKGRFLYIWLIEYGGFFHGDEGIPVKRGSSKIRKYQGRAEWLSGDVIGNSASADWRSISKITRGAPSCCQQRWEARHSASS